MTTGWQVCLNRPDKAWYLCASTNDYFIAVITKKFEGKGSTNRERLLVEPLTHYLQDLIPTGGGTKLSVRARTILTGLRFLFFSQVPEN